MLALNQVRHATRVRCFVEGGFLESDAISIEVPGPKLARREYRDGGRIDTPAQKRTDRDIGNEPTPHGAAEQRTQLLAPLRFRVGRNVLERFEHEIPILPDPQRAARDVV